MAKKAAESLLGIAGEAALELTNILPTCHTIFMYAAHVCIHKYAWMMDGYIVTVQMHIPLRGWIHLTISYIVQCYLSITLNVSFACLENFLCVVQSLRHIKVGKFERTRKAACVLLGIWTV